MSTTTVQKPEVESRTESTESRGHYIGLDRKLPDPDGAGTDTPTPAESPISENGPNKQS